MTQMVLGILAHTSADIEKLETDHVPPLWDMDTSAFEIILMRKASGKCYEVILPDKFDL